RAEGETPLRQAQGRLSGQPARCRRYLCPLRSENKLQAELHRTRASRTHGRVGGGDVRSGTAAAEATHGRIIEAETILPAIRIGEVGMVENVEELRPELGVEALAEMPVLGQREIHVFETGIRKNVASHGAEGSQWRRNQDGIAFGVAAVEGQGFSCRTWGSSIECESFCVAGRVTRRHGWGIISGEEWNTCRPRLEVVRVPIEIPPDGAVRRRTDGQRTYAGSIGSLVHHPPVLRTLQGDDGVEFPTFQGLCVALLSGDSVGERNGEAMPDIEIAVGVFAVRIISVLRQSRSVTE